MRSIRSHEIDYLLTAPEKLYSCDLQTMGRDDVPKSFEARRTIQRDGRLDDDNAFSTFPDQKRTHWSTPNFRVEPRECKKGDVVDFRMRIDDIRSMARCIRWRWDSSR